MLLLFCVPVWGQTNYFQQEVDYKIKVSLDDVAHKLSGSIQIDYSNKSPQALPEIWMHLWGNAFKSRNTAFARQKLDAGSTEFYFAKDSMLGGYEEIDFKVNGKSVKWKYDSKNPDIAVLKLSEPLASGKKLQISADFVLKIPASFSRLGHVETSYQMTQWYPKPAVYDATGWHAMPYLDMGEFYSEFGSFDVEIELPANYVVGASGTLQTPSEIEFLKQKEAETIAYLDTVDNSPPKKSKRAAPFPASSSERKTIRFIAEQVHDFAWFADKRFYVLKDTAVLESGKTVDCWAMFTDEQRHLWLEGDFYVKRAVEFYSKHVGEYPWPQATAVHSALSAGGGMEYPMITVIGDSGSKSGLDDVITHEVGHNWFYGILASNERDHPFMDEGLNTYYENRYMKEYYGGSNLNIGLPKYFYNAKEQGDLVELGNLFLAREMDDTPPDSHSDDFSLIGYGLQVYMKTGRCLRWLENALGVETFDMAMKHYYEKWKFKHPGPDDLRQAWKEVGVEADWFFDAMQTQKHSDVALTNVNKTTENTYVLQLKEKGNLAAPYAVGAIKNDEVVRLQWFEPIKDGKTQITFSTDEPVDAFIVDPEHEMLDFQRKNNMRKTGGAFAGMEPLQIKAGALLENPTKTQIGFMPWVGWNQYDNAVLGLLFYNTPVPTSKFQYYFAPAIGAGSGECVGIADVRYRLFPGGLFPRIVLGVNAKTFNFDYNWRDKYYTRYYRVAPQIEFDLRSGNKTFEHSIRLRSLFIGTEEGEYDDIGKLTGTKFQKSLIHEIRYAGENMAFPNPFQYSFALEQQSYDLITGADAHYLRASLEWKQDFYYKNKRRITARAFAGFFLENTQRESGAVSNSIARGSFALNPQGFNDYQFDQWFLGRSENTGILSRQVSQTQGGFKNAFGAPYAGSVGNSNNYILALNLKADLPVRLPLGIPLKPWFDIGYFDDASPLGSTRPSSEMLLWSGGFMLEFLKGGIEVYFPLVNSKSLRDRYCEYSGGDDSGGLFCGGNYWKWVSWSFRLNRIDPIKTTQKLMN
ncbi:MAG: M1 family metallopeptidase [Saprospiraceae bacterium]